MNIIETITGMRQIRKQLAEPVGLVPTMGYLHEGHLSLVRQAGIDNPSVVVSIFVNPTQFEPWEDFKTYPRNTARDLAMLKKENTDIVFMPSIDEMYPSDFESWVEVAIITKKLEGASRPRHFRGVATLVAKLFNVVQPNRTYFGQKDAQQVMVVKKMVADLDMNVEIVNLPTLREADGLAMSSRNTHLNSEQRQAATILYEALQLSKQLYDTGVRDAEQLRQRMKTHIQKQPLANIEYISLADTKTLDEFKRIETPALVSLAVRIGNTRLIDNIVLT